MAAEHPARTASTPPEAPARERQPITRHLFADRLPSATSPGPPCCPASRTRHRAWGHPKERRPDAAEREAIRKEEQAVIPRRAAPQNHAERLAPLMLPPWWPTLNRPE